jgi:hypothetical protein
LTSLARRLVAYFVFLAVVPLLAGFLGFTAVIERSEQNRVDEGLQAGLRATLATYDTDLVIAQKSAERLARSTAFQRAVVRHDRSVLAAFIADLPGLRVESGGLQVGKAYPYAGERRVQFVGSGKPAGELIASVPLNPASLRRFDVLAGIPSDEKLMPELRHRGTGEVGRERDRPSSPQRQGLPGCGLASGQRSRIGGIRARNSASTRQ